MNNVQITTFGEINLDELEETYESEIIIDGQPITLDLNFDDDDIEEEWIEEYEHFMDHIVDIKNHIVKVQYEDFLAEGIIKDYVDHHLGELDEDDLEDLLGEKDENISDEEALFRAIEIQRIGFYPGYEEFVVWDFGIGYEYSDYVLAVTTDTQGNILSIEMES